MKDNWYSVKSCSVYRYFRLIYTLFFFILPQSSAFAQKTKIEIIAANSLESDQHLCDNCKRLIGDVIFKHENAFLYCDSAYFFPNNIIEAFSRIRMIQGDSLSLLGDHLNYDGNTKIAQVRGDVTLKHKGMILKTHFLDFDRSKNIGYYYNHGVITDKENVLNSARGFYYSKLYDFISIDSVTLTNKKYTMYSDTLKYNTRTKISFFQGPTLIRSGDTSYIYCENGWYNTQTEISQYNKHAFMVNRAQKISGDSIYYDRNAGFGKAYMNVEIRDTIEKVILRGNYGYYYQKPEKGLMTENAVMLQISQKDSLRKDTLFLHADTIRFDLDSSQKYKFFRAYHHVKLFKTDIQGKCDSVIYSMKDSVINMFNKPVIWSEENQLTADSIQIFSKNNQVDHLVLKNTAFIISKDDSIRFNQLKGKTITGFVKNNELTRIDVKGNGQSIYFAKDGNDYIGANKAESSNMVIYRKDKKIDSILFLISPDATLFPVEQFGLDVSRLKDFSWLEKHRPLTKYDIFKWID